MSVAIDIFEGMFEYRSMLRAAVLAGPLGDENAALDDDEVFEPGDEFPDDQESYDSPDEVSRTRIPDISPGGERARQRGGSPEAAGRSVSRGSGNAGSSAEADDRGASRGADRTDDHTDDHGAETVQELQARIRNMQGTRLDTRSLPTHPAIASLLPGGGLKQGAAYSVERSATLLMALLAGPSAAGSWCGVVGMPEFGVEAASHYGIDLERLVLVPHPGDQWLQVTAAIADVLTVVVTRPPRQASGSSISRLAARLRQRGSTLIVLGPWPQTDAMLSITHSEWSGIGDGFGHLAAREVTVTVSTRAGVRPRSAKLWLPDTAERFSASTGGGSLERASFDEHTALRELAG